MTGIRYTGSYGDGTGSYGDGRGFVSYGDGRGQDSSAEEQLRAEFAEWDRERGPRRLRLIEEVAFA